MAINNITKNQVLDKTNAISTSEATYRDGLSDIIEQVDTNQIHMDAGRTISLTGDITGTSASYVLNESGDYTVSINTTYAAQVDNNNITDNTISANKLTNSTITNPKIAAGTITEDKINSGSRTELRVLDTNGSTVLFSGDLLNT